MMTIREALNYGAEKLKLKGVSSARLDAELLLAHTLNKSREYLLAHDETTLTAAKSKIFLALLARRAKFEPLAYITGRKEFYGLSLSVNKSVLIPRPETEQLVEQVIKYFDADSAATIFDLGTGSGAIALACKKLRPAAQVIATDVSASALSIARKNARNLGLKVAFHQSDLLAGLKPKDLAGAIIAANLPYLDRAELADLPAEIKAGLKFEPSSALFARAAGTALYDKLFRQINRLPAKPKAVIAEIGSYGYKHFMAVAKSHFPHAKISLLKDAARRPRFIVIDL